MSAMKSALSSAVTGWLERRDRPTTKLKDPQRKFTKARGVPDASRLGEWRRKRLALQSTSQMRDAVAKKSSGKKYHHIVHSFTPTGRKSPASF